MLWLTVGRLVGWGGDGLVGKWVAGLLNEHMNGQLRGWVNI